MASIHKRGNTYLVKYRTYENGTPKQHTKGGFARRKDAAAFAAQIEASITAGTYADAAWLDTYCTHLRPNSRADLRNSITKHIIPALGNIKLKQLRTVHIQNFYNTIMEKYYREPVYKEVNGLKVLDKPGKKYSPGQLHHIHKALNQALNRAVTENLIPVNPATHTKRPVVQPLDITPPAPEKIGELLGALSRDPIYPAILACALLGMRRGEALGLMWPDVDLDAGVVRLQRSFTINNETGHSEISGLKSASSRRNIPIPEVLRQKLIEQKKRQAQLAAERSDIYAISQFVFTDEAGLPIKPNRPSQTFKRYAKRCGLPNMRLHDLRHAYATYLLDSGESVKTVQQLLGHSDAVVTLKRYAHALEESKKRSAEKMNSMYSVPHSYHSLDKK